MSEAAKIEDEEASQGWPHKCIYFKLFCLILKVLINQFVYSLYVYPFTLKRELLSCCWTHGYKADLILLILTPYVFHNPGH